MCDTPKALDGPENGLTPDRWPSVTEDDPPSGGALPATLNR